MVKKYFDSLKNFFTKKSVLNTASLFLTTAKIIVKISHIFGDFFFVLKPTIPQVKFT